MILKTIIFFIAMLISTNVLLAAKPNVLLIMADDVGVESFGTYGGLTLTPNINQLAAEGIRFDHAYSQPLCTQSRTQLMTGRYNFRNYHTFGYLDPHETNIAQIMRNAGYTTGIAGKWQLNVPNPPRSEFDSPIIPEGPVFSSISATDMQNRYGFDKYTLWQLNHLHNNSRYWNPILEQNTGPSNTVLSTNSTDYGPDISSNSLLEFIENAHSSDQPFFAYYPMELPHSPWVSTPDSDPDSTITNRTARFKENVEYIDSIVGRFIDKIDELNIRDNTIIIFTSDNGAHRHILTQTAQGSVRGGKGTTTDAGTHVPLIVSWPNHIAPNQTTDQLVDFSDFLPTLANIAGADLPDTTIDGQPFINSDGTTPEQTRASIYSWYKHNTSPVAYARNQQYKLYDNGQFFDISQDPLELPENSISLGDGSGEDETARAKLQEVMDSFATEANGTPKLPNKVMMLAPISGTITDLDSNGTGDTISDSVIAVKNLPSGKESRAIIKFPLNHEDTIEAIRKSHKIELLLSLAEPSQSPFPLSIATLINDQDQNISEHDFDSEESIIDLVTVSLPSEIIQINVTNDVLNNFYQDKPWIAFRFKTGDPSLSSQDILRFSYDTGTTTHNNARLVFSLPEPSTICVLLYTLILVVNKRKINK